jgi:hypothetical protein
MKRLVIITVDACTNCPFLGVEDSYSSHKYFCKFNSFITKELEDEDFDFKGWFKYCALPKVEQ